MSKYPKLNIWQFAETHNIDWRPNTMDLNLYLRLPWECADCGHLNYLFPESVSLEGGGMRLVILCSKCNGQSIVKIQGIFSYKLITEAAVLLDNITKKCRNHRGKEALNFCYSCGSYFCDDCLTLGKEYFYCKEEKCRKAREQELEDFNKSDEDTFERIPLIGPPQKGFFKYLSGVISGRISKGNQLVGNHHARISKKGEKCTDFFLKSIVKSTSFCTVNFLIELLIEIKKFEYFQGTCEANPFHDNLHKLDEKNSYEMFKLAAENSFAQFLAKDFYSLPLKYVIDVEREQLKNSFFEIYEYTDSDKALFNELMEFCEKDLLPDYRLFDYMFENIYNMEPPEQISQKTYFSALFQSIHRAMFPEAFMLTLEEYKKSNS